ncbi:MAG TPA: DMT family transporter [Candidatus Dormibacteraeota bacterium]
MILSAGFIYGLGAAIAFALADPGAAYLSRRMGALGATLLVAIGGLPLIALGTVVYNEPLATSVSATLVALGLGVGAAISYVGLYYAFAVGPLSVVGPITALFGTVTVLFAVLFLGERLTFGETAAVIIAATGSVLAAVELKGGGKLKFVGAGPLAALGAVLLGSAVTVMMQHPIRADGWVPTVIGVRIGVSIAAGIGLFVVSRYWPGMAGLDGPSSGFTLPRRFLGFIFLIGCFDAAAFSSFSIGLSAAPAWLVAIVAATSPMVLLVGGLFVLRERLRPLQWVGVAFVFCSMAIIALG